MKIWNLFKKRSEGDRVDGIERFFHDISAGNTAAGVRVTATSAQRVAAVYACIQGIAETVAMLPASIYQELDDKTKNKYKDHPLYPILHDSPNSYMDSFQFFELMTAALYEEGNAAFHIGKDRNGTVRELIPMVWNNVKVEVLSGNKLLYHYKDGAGQTFKYPQTDVLHIRHRSKDGIIGRSPIQVAAESVGFVMAVQQHGNKSFENGLFHGGIVESPVRLQDDEARSRLLESIRAGIKGAKNTGKLMLLEGGVQFKPNPIMNNRDAQFLELLKAGVLDVARIFRMPPNMIQEIENGASYASIEQNSINFVLYTIQPVLTRIEKAIRSQMLMVNGEDNIYLKFNEKALLRGDLKSQVEAVVQQIQYGLKSINEARALQDDNPIDDPAADEIMVSHNLIPISKVGQNPQSAPKTEPKEPEKVEEKALNKQFKSLFQGRFKGLIDLETKSLKRIFKDNKPDFKAFDDFLAKYRDLILEEIEPLAKAYSEISGKTYPEERFKNFMNLFMHRREEFKELNEEARILYFSDVQHDPEADADLLIKILGV